MLSNHFRSVVLLSAASGSLLVGGCGTNATISNPGTSSSTPAPLASGGAQNVYAAVDNATPVVVQYGATANSSTIPVNSINITATPDVEAIGIDKTTGTVYVTGYSYTDGQPEIWAYAAGSTGSPTPTRTIMMGLTSTTEPLDLTVDPAGNVYVAVVDENSGLGSVLEYSATATGAATPLKIISGTATGIVTPLALAVDTAGTVYVGSATGYNVYQGTVLEFASTATGNVAPLRSIAAPSGTYFAGLAVDANLTLYATEGAGGANGIYPNAKLVEFAAGASGTATPSKTITSPSIGALYGVQVDSVGNVYVLNQTSSSSLNILAFGPNVNGYLTPGLSLAPSALNAATTTSLALK